MSELSVPAASELSVPAVSELSFPALSKLLSSVYIWIFIFSQQIDELEGQKRLRTEMIQVEDNLAQTRKEYDMLRIEFEQAMAANDQNCKWYSVFVLVGSSCSCGLEALDGRLWWE